jgi:hypothetical protein
MPTHLGAKIPCSEIQRPLLIPARVSLLQVSELARRSYEDTLPCGELERVSCSLVLKDD